MEKSLLIQKFTHSSRATTIYWHICKFTGKRFASPVRRLTYSPEGLRLKLEQDRLKREHNQLLKEAAKQSCKVYFYHCSITGIWFTTRIPGSRFAPESKAITHQAQIDYGREHRKLPEVRERERIRSANRKEYRKAWHERRAKQSAEVNV